MEFQAYMWSVTDWRTDDIYNLLTTEERGAYRELIDECWLNGSIPNDVARLARLAHISEPAMKQVWPILETKFQKIDGNRLISRRLEKDRERLQIVRTERSRSGKKGAEARWKDRPKRRQSKRVNGTANGKAMAKPMAKNGQTTDYRQQIVNDSLILNGVLDGSNSETHTRYGEHGCVLLTPTEYARLREKLDGLADEYIERLDRYAGTNPKHFKQYGHHYRVVLTWYNNDIRDGRITQPVKHAPTSHTRMDRHFCRFCNPPHEWKCTDPLCSATFDLACEKITK